MTTEFLLLIYMFAINVTFKQNKRNGVSGCLFLVLRVLPGVWVATSRTLDVLVLLSNQPISLQVKSFAKVTASCLRELIVVCSLP